MVYALNGGVGGIRLCHRSSGRKTPFPENDDHLRDHRIRCLSVEDYIDTRSDWHPLRVSRTLYGVVTQSGVEACSDLTSGGNHHHRHNHDPSRIDYLDGVVKVTVYEVGSSRHSVGEGDRCSADLDGVRHADEDALRNMISETLGHPELLMLMTCHVPSLDRIHRYVFPYKCADCRSCNVVAREIDRFGRRCLLHSDNRLPVPTYPSLSPYGETCLE